MCYSCEPKIVMKKSLHGWQSKNKFFLGFSENVESEAKFSIFFLHFLSVFQFFFASTSFTTLTIEAITIICLVKDIVDCLSTQQCF